MTIERTDKRKERLKERLEKKKKEDRVFNIIFYSIVGIPILAIVGGVVWLLFHYGGLIGLVVAIICAVVFIPEIFKEKR